jgi:serine-type D-Ala-D-Ala carboxypeptidase (penicillin-binding protein 5/6)
MGTILIARRPEPSQISSRVGRTSTPPRGLTSTDTRRSIPDTRGGRSVADDVRRIGSPRRGSEVTSISASSTVSVAPSWYARPVMRLRWLVVLVTALLAAAIPAHAAVPAPQAAAYILVNPATGETLARRAPDRSLPMASTTKIMTALVAVTRTRPEDLVTIPAAATTIGESTADLVAGEQVAMGDLPVALLVGSGNDAAYSIAEHTGGSQDAFVGQMNAEAERLGLTQTHFANPHGLDAAGHFSSVRDLVTMGERLMAVPALRGIVGQRRANIPGPNGVGIRALESKNDLLDIDRDADGIKTGNTDGAGYALVAHARRPALGVELYAAIIGSPSETRRATDAKRLLDWGFAQYARPVLVPAAQVLARAAVRDRPGVWLDLRAAGALREPMRLGTPLTESIEAPTEVIAPVAAGTVIGRVIVRQGGKVIGTQSLVAARSVEAPSTFERIRAGIGSIL